MNVWIVSGGTGEYSDFCGWHVKAFMDEHDARDLCDALNKWCEENGMAMEKDGGHCYADYDIRISAECPMDPGFHCDYTGTEYHVWSMEVDGLDDVVYENMENDV